MIKLIEEDGWALVRQRGSHPGCVALGDTLEACEQEMREAIAFHVEGLREHGDPVPRPVAVAAALVEVRNA